MQSYIQNLISEHEMDHESVWIVEDNARSLRYSGPSRLSGHQRMNPQLGESSMPSTDCESDRRGQFHSRGSQRSDSAIPSGVERSSRLTPLRRSMGKEYKAPRTAIEPLRRNWYETRDSSLCCPVRRVSNDFTSLEALDLDSLEFDSSEFNSGEFTSLGSIIEEPFGSSYD
ncbi:MAG: hypothetical protein SGBAC_010854 [Bacillariaceae sp.]